MKTIIWILMIALAGNISGCASAAKQSKQKKEAPSASFSASTPTSTVVAAANEFVRKAGLDWGKPEEVRWQDGSPPDNSGRWKGTGEPLNRWLVIYPTPDSELSWAGSRGVHVDVNGLAWFVPRG